MWALPHSQAKHRQASDTAHYPQAFRMKAVSSTLPFHFLNFAVYPGMMQSRVQLNTSVKFRFNFLFFQVGRAGRPGFATIGKALANVSSMGVALEDSEPAALRDM